MAFKMDISGALKGLVESEIKMKVAVSLYANTNSKSLEAYAKENANWTDRTAQARQTIQGTHEWQGNKCNICLLGNKDYSPYLEFCNEGRFAILYPTVREKAPEIIAGMSNLLGK